MSNFVLENKIKEIDTITERMVLNINNKYKTLKNNIIDSNYKLLYYLYYTNTLERPKRIYIQRKMLVEVKLLDYYYYKLYSYKEISKDKYISISKKYITITKLIYGWIKSESRVKWYRRCLLKDKKIY
mgnify:CR=1 FL=1